MTHRPSRWSTRFGCLIPSYDYGQDIGNLHVIDYHLHRATLGIRPFSGSPPPAYLRSPADWSQP